MKHKEIETCLMVLDSIEEDRQDYKELLKHRPLALELKMIQLDTCFSEWQNRLTRLERKTYP